MACGEWLLLHLNQSAAKLAPTPQQACSLTPHTIRLIPADVLPDGQIAGFKRINDGLETQVWVSTSLPNDQATRALNGVIAQAVAQKRMERGIDTPAPKDAGKYDQLGGMLEHLENVKKQELKPVTLEQGKKERVRNADENARNESPARIHAELDLFLHQMGIGKPGEARDRALADMEKMDPRLAAKVRKHLEQGPGIGFRPEGALQDPSQVAKPKATQDSLPGSEVLGATPESVHPYSEADRQHVMELRLALEQIKEIDTRLKQRDQRGTQDRDTVIAKGESMRRRELVEQAKALMERLQLGGLDPKYYKERLDELERVFPGVKDYVEPMV